MTARALTRRQTIGLLAAAPLAASVPYAASAEETVAAFLKTIRLSRQPARLGLVALSETSRGLEVVVDLTWPPGYRRRRFVAGSREAICAELETYFTALG